jgi:hypothetical protein
MFSSSARIPGEDARSASNSNNTSRFAAAARSPVFPSSSSAFLQQLRSIFIQTADTPNPESLKFIPLGNSERQRRREWFYVTKQDSATEILRSPLAKVCLMWKVSRLVYLGAAFDRYKFAEQVEIFAAATV